MLGKSRNYLLLVFMMISLDSLHCKSTNINNELHYKVPEKYKVRFDESMEFDKVDVFFQERQIKKEMYLTKFCKKLFEKNSLEFLPPMQESLIPKKLHLIWVGPNTPPPVFTKCKESVKEYLPDWEVKIWTDQDILGLNLANKEYYDEETNYGAKADILRYEILYRYGGVYLDIDFILHESLNILNHTYEVYACCMPSQTDDVIANGLIGSAAQHPILKRCVEKVKENRHYDDILHRTGPFLFQSAFYEYAKEHMDKRLIALPKSFFFPLDPHQRFSSQAETQKLIKPEAFAVHYWADSWDENPFMMDQNI